MSEWNAQLIFILSQMRRSLVVPHDQTTIMQTILKAHEYHATAHENVVQVRRKMNETVVLKVTSHRQYLKNVVPVDRIPTLKTVLYVNDSYVTLPAKHARVHRK